MFFISYAKRFVAKTSEFWHCQGHEETSNTIRMCRLRAATLTMRPGVKWAGTGRYGVPADAISVPADSASEIVKFTISIPRESCTNAKAKYSRV